MVSSEIQRLEEDGSVHEDGHLAVQDAFFNVDPIKQDGIDALLRGQIGQFAQAFDTKVIDDLNFFLESAGGVAGFSLPALNIMRGRDHGIDTYVNVRAQLIGDFDPDLIDPNDFSMITSDPALKAELAAVYDTVHDVDLWVGGLAEDKIPGTQMGPLFTAILTDQFTRTRAADETFGDLDPMIGEEIAAEVAATTLADIIERNSLVEHVQADVFQAAIRIGPDDKARGSDDFLIVGDGMDNVLCGRRGDDALFGDDGNDKLMGHRGNDELYGGLGEDHLRGGRGDDLLEGGAGTDKLKGDGGDDILHAGDGNDRVYGGAGDDRLTGGAGDDYLSAAAGGVKRSRSC